MWLWYQWKMWLKAFCALGVHLLPLASCSKNERQRRAFFSESAHPPGQHFQLKTFGSSWTGWHSSQAGRFQSMEHQVSAVCRGVKGRGHSAFCACCICVKIKLGWKLPPHLNPPCCSFLGREAMTHSSAMQQTGMCVVWFIPAHSASRFLLGQLLLLRRRSLIVS